MALGMAKKKREKEDVSPPSDPFRGEGKNRRKWGARCFASPKRRQSLPT